MKVNLGGYYDCEDRRPKKASEKWEKKYKQRIIRIAPEKDEQLVALAKKKSTSINALLNTAIDLILDEDR